MDRYCCVCRRIIVYLFHHQKVRQIVGIPIEIERVQNVSNVPQITRFVLIQTLEFKTNHLRVRISTKRVTWYVGLVLHSFVYTRDDERNARPPRPERHALKLTTSLADISHNGENEKKQQLFSVCVCMCLSVSVALMCIKPMVFALF